MFSQWLNTIFKLLVKALIRLRVCGEVNTKYISSSVLKTSEFSRVHNYAQSDFHCCKSHVAAHLSVDKKITKLPASQCLQLLHFITL